jgi:hypothetical protein
MAEPILSLDTLVERQVVRIDGKDYELKIPGELSVLDFHRIGKRHERVEALQKRGESGEITEEEVSELQSLIDWLCRFVFVAPGDVVDRLNYNQKLRVIWAFINLLGEYAPPAPAGGIVEAAPASAPEAIEQASDAKATSTGESSSPA